MSNCIVISIENLERIGTNVTIITLGPPIITRQLLRFLIATFILARRLDICSWTQEESEILIFSEIISLLFAGLTRFTHWWAEAFPFSRNPAALGKNVELVQVI